MCINNTIRVKMVNVYQVHNVQDEGQAIIRPLQPAQPITHTKQGQGNLPTYNQTTINHRAKQTGLKPTTNPAKAYLNTN